ncbi:MAG: GNAT family N-acetyltransferase [Myxococcales bacterium]|nr:GNAT family N-acetyltransferase [Myxococcales bacterium]
MSALYTLRAATANDAAAIVLLCRLLAEFERLPGPDDAAAARFADDLARSPAPCEALVAEQDGAVVAYAVFFASYSTFRARPGIYLEDLFVHPRARRLGIAHAMLDRLVELGRERGCARLEWQVLRWNEGAIRLYEHLSAHRQDDWVGYRLDL